MANKLRWFITRDGKVSLQKSHTVTVFLDGRHVKTATVWIDLKPGEVGVEFEKSSGFTMRRPEVVNE